MAGRPGLRKLRQAIEDRGGVEWFLEEVASGKLMKWIADDLGVSRQFLYHWKKLEQKDDPTLLARYNLARKEAGHALAEEAVTIVDEASVESIVVDKERAYNRRWLSGKFSGTWAM